MIIHLLILSYVYILFYSIVLRYEIFYSIIMVINKNGKIIEILGCLTYLKTKVFIVVWFVEKID
jgi:hypothetical protein